MSQEIEREPSLGMWEDSVWPMKGNIYQSRPGNTKKPLEYGRERLCDAPEKWSTLENKIKDMAQDESVEEYFDYVRKKYGWNMTIGCYRKRASCIFHSLTHRNG